MSGGPEVWKMRTVNRFVHTYIFKYGVLSQTFLLLFRDISQIRFLQKLLRKIEFKNGQIKTKPSCHNSILDQWPSGY